MMSKYFDSTKILDYEDAATRCAVIGVKNVNSAMSTIDALRQQLADVSNERDGLRASQGWVKCSDRLPECPHECTSDETMVSNTMWVTDSSDPGSMGMAHMRKDGSWKLYGGDYDFMVPETITHWMPLPAAPSAEVKS